MADEHVVHDYRIGEGGLLRRFEIATHLTRLRWQVLSLLALTWAPIVVIGVSTQHPDALVYQAALHVRLLVAAPVFLILDQLFPAVCRYTLMQLQTQAFIPAAAQTRVDGVLRSAARMADSSLPEGVLAALGLGLGLAALRGMVPISGLTHSTGLTPDQVWYVLTDLPIFQFLLWRSVWRWVIWVRILVGLSRVKLDLVPTHPDRCGGIRFLRLPSVGYCAMLLFAASSVLCAEYGNRLTLGATLESFTPLLLVFASAGTLIAFGPLCLFVPQLLFARRRGMLEVGTVATRSGRIFRNALLDRERVVSAENIQDLANLEHTYRETVDQLRIVLFDRRDMGLLLLATLLPVVPVMVMHIPLEDWRALTGLLTGWKP